MKNHTALACLAVLALSAVATPSFAGPDWATIERARVAAKARSEQPVQARCAALVGHPRIAFQHGPRGQAIGIKSCGGTTAPAIASSQAS